MKLVWKQVLLDRQGSILPVVDTGPNLSNTVGKQVAAFVSVFITRDATDALRSRQVAIAVRQGASCGCRPVHVMPLYNTCRAAIIC
jgi:hypothetical protein